MIRLLCNFRIIRIDVVVICSQEVGNTPKLLLTTYLTLDGANSVCFDFDSDVNITSINKMEKLPVSCQICSNTNDLKPLLDLNKTFDLTLLEILNYCLAIEVRLLLCLFAPNSNYSIFL